MRVREINIVVMSARARALRICSSYFFTSTASPKTVKPVYSSAYHLRAISTPAWSMAFVKKIFKKDKKGKLT